MGNTFVPHAGTHICNSGGIEIMLHPSNDGLWYRYTWDIDEKTEPKEAEIQYFGSDGDEIFEDFRAGFETDKGCRFYLDEMLRLN